MFPTGAEQLGPDHIVIGQLHDLRLEKGLKIKPQGSGGARAAGEGEAHGITAARLARIRQLVSKRQRGFVVVLENRRSDDVIDTSTFSFYF